MFFVPWVWAQGHKMPSETINDKEKRKTKTLRELPARK